MKNFLKRLFNVVLLPFLLIIVLGWWCIVYISLAITIAIAPAVYLFTGIELVDMWIDTVDSIEDKFLEKIDSLYSNFRML